MSNTERILSPGVLHTQFGAFRLLQSHPIKRDDHPYKQWNTFYATPYEPTYEVHVPGRAITVAGPWSVDWFWAWIDVAKPKEDDPDWREYVEDVVTDQTPTVPMPENYPEHDECCIDDESE